MTQVKDEKHQARLAGGLFTTHGQMKERQNNCDPVCRKRKRWWGGGGFFPGFQSDTKPAPHMVRHTQTKTNSALSQQHLGVGWEGWGGNFLLCCYGNTEFVVFSLPLTRADVSKHILVKCVPPLEPIARSATC